MTYKTITVSIDEETYWLACARATEMETSVENYAGELLGDHVREGSEKELDARRERAEELRLAEHERLRMQMNRVLEEIRASGGGLIMKNNLTREELHDRDRARREAREWYEAKRREMLKR